MSRKHRQYRSGFKTQEELTYARGNAYFIHYYHYLINIVNQMFTWEGLPPSVDEIFMENVLQSQGQIAFVKHPSLGYVVGQGASHGRLDIYGNPTQYNIIFPNGMLNHLGNVFNFTDNKEGKDTVIIKNTPFKHSAYPSIKLFAEDLSHIKQVTKINITNQKTPYIVGTNRKQLLSTLKALDQHEAGASKIVVDEEFDKDTLQAVLTPAPYVADKLSIQLMTVWNEIVTFLGIDNANVQKRERLNTDEVNANNEQGQASENIFLKPRLQACKMINELWDDLDVKVGISTEVVRELNEFFESEVDRLERIQSSNNNNTW